MESPAGGMIGLLCFVLAVLRSLTIQVEVTA
jgi:hypothetical protein